MQTDFFHANSGFCAQTPQKRFKATKQRSTAPIRGMWTLQCEKRGTKSTWTRLNTVLPLLPKSCLSDKEDIVNFHEKGKQCSHHVVSVTNPSVNPNWRRPDSCQIQLRLFFYLDSFPQRPTLLHSSVFFMTANRRSVFSWSWTSLLLCGSSLLIRARTI